MPTKGQGMGHTVTLEGGHMDRLNQVDFQGATGYGVHDILDYMGESNTKHKPTKNFNRGKEKSHCSG
jgi:hypothetical protein